MLSWLRAALGRAFGWVSERSGEKTGLGRLNHESMDAPTMKIPHVQY